MSDMPERICIASEVIDWSDGGCDCSLIADSVIAQEPSDYIDVEYIRADLAAEQIERLEAERRECQKLLGRLLTAYIQNDANGLDEVFDGLRFSIDEDGEPVVSHAKIDAQHGRDGDE